MPGFLRNQKIRNILLQALFVAVVLIIVVGGWRNAKATLEAQHIVSGFVFWKRRPAGMSTSRCCHIRPAIPIGGSSSSAS